MPDGELVRLRLERPHHETLEPLCDVLRLAHVIQVLDDFFGCFHAAEYDVRTAGEPLFVAGCERVAPLLCGELLGAEHLPHAVGEDFGACARHGTEPGLLEYVEQFVQSNVVELRDAHEFHRREPTNLHAHFLREHLEHVGVVVERDFSVHAPLQKDLVGAFGLRFNCLLPDFIEAEHVGFWAMCWPAKTAKAACDFADVRVVHDAECRVAHLVFGVHAPAHGIGGLRDLGPRGTFQQFERFGGGDAFPLHRFQQNGIHANKIILFLLIVNFSLWIYCP